MSIYCHLSPYQSSKRIMRCLNSLRKWGRKTAETSQGPQDDELFSTKGDYGLKEWANASNSMVDIVFVHGLTGNRTTTWQYKNNAPWPEDFLAKKLDNAHILTFGYDADVVGAITTAGGNNLRGHGKSLADNLAARRKMTKTNLRPLIFVAHSLGGLVVEQALLVCRGSSEPHVKEVLEATTGILFMGTPHMGANLADWGAALTRLSHLVRATNKDLVKVLQPGSEMLANVQQEFHAMLNDRQRNDGKIMEIFCFYEEVPMPVVGLIVPERSAVLPAYPNASIHSDHVGMTKFQGSDDAGFVQVFQRLYLWVDSIREAQLNEEVRTPEDMGELHNAPRLLEFGGTVNSEGGPVFQGQQRAGRDIVVGGKGFSVSRSN